MHGISISWKQNLVFAWLSQFFSILGFSFAMPFVAYFIQRDLGVTDPREAAIWNGLFHISAPISLAIMSPVWGMLADKYGRKIMMLRANFGASVLLVMMGFAWNAPVLVSLRLLQGVLTGTVTAAQALVASYTPERRQGVALGSMAAAVFAGMSIGNWAGGVFAYHYGYRNAFFFSGVIVLVSAFLVVFGIRERFVRKPATGQPPKKRRRRIGLPDVGIGLPILGLVMCVGFIQHFDRPVLPFLVQEIHGAIEGAELWMGRVNMMFCLGAFVAGFLVGRAADRFAPGNVAKVAAVGAAAFMIPHALGTSFGWLLPARVGMAFFVGSIEPVFQIWLARVTPPERRGSVFGWGVTARSVGWIFGPSLSVAISVTWGIRYSYFTMSALFLLLIPAVVAVTRMVDHPATEGRFDELYGEHASLSPQTAPEGRMAAAEKAGGGEG